MSGIQVQLCNASNVIIATATTDAQGKYLFSNLVQGIYVVKFPASFTGGKTITTNNPITVNLGAGQNYLDADAGYKPATTNFPTITINDITVNESAGNATLQICLSSAATSTITVNYATSSSTASGDVDYSRRSGIVTFNAGERCKNILQY